MIKAQEKREGKKARSKSQDCCVTFKSKLLQILLIAHAWGSKADILYLEQMNTKTMTCKSFGRFYFFFVASQRPENSSTVAFIHILWQNSQNQWVKEDSWVLSQEILSLDWTLGTQIGWTNEMRFYLQPTSYSLSHSGIWLTMTPQSFRKMSQVMVFRGLNNFIHRVSRQLWPGKGAIRSFFTKI